MVQLRASRPAEITSRALLVGISAALLLCGILDAGILHSLSTLLFQVPEHEGGSDADVWSRILASGLGLTLLAAARGSWADVTLVLAVVLVAAGLVRSHRDVQHKLDTPASVVYPFRPLQLKAGGARLIIPKAKINPPVATLHAGVTVRLVAVVPRRDVTGRAMVMRAATYTVMLRKPVAAKKLTTDPLVDYVPPGSSRRPGTHLAEFVRDLRQAERIYVLPAAAP